MDAPVYFPSMVMWFLTEIVVGEIVPCEVNLEHCLRVVEWEFEGRNTAELAIALLPDRLGKEHYALKDLAPVAGTIQPGHLSRHAAELWPTRKRTAGNGNYQLSIQDATALLRRYYNIGKTCFERPELEKRVAERVLAQIRCRHRVRPALCDAVSSAVPAHPAL